VLISERSLKGKIYISGLSQHGMRPEMYIFPIPTLPLLIGSSIESSYIENLGMDQAPVCLRQRNRNVQLFK